MTQRCSHDIRAPHQRGIALVSVLFISLVLILLTAIFSFTLVSERRSVSATVRMNASAQLADGVSERARMRLVELYKASGSTPRTFIRKLENNQISELNGSVNTETVGTLEGRWKVLGHSDSVQENRWVDIAATGKSGNGVQTVVRRINFGSPAIFDLAMLSEDTNCVYCHLRVNGDVGNYNTFRPGWGIEGTEGMGSGGGSGGSVVNGNVYLAGTTTADDTDKSGSGPIKLNGALFNGDLEENYTGPELDMDADGNPNFPPLNRDYMEDNARGTLLGGTRIVTVANGSVLSGVPSGNGTINNRFDGNVVLEGTEANPLILDGDIYVSGDVVIKGVVKGKGAIYAGRNVYLAGDLTVKTPPDEPGTGVCSGISDPDSCAKENLKDSNIDELRIGARGNIVMGDYTRTTAGGGDKLWQEMQGPDYFRDQFGFWGGANFRYANNGDELECITDPTTGTETCTNVDGDVVPASDQYGGGSNIDGWDAYQWSLQPGRVTSGGFQNWLPDDVYQSFLGTERRAYNSWRMDFDSTQLAALTVDELKKQLQGMVADEPFDVSDASITEVFNALQPGVPTADNLDLKDVNGNPMGSLYWTGSRIYAIIDPPADYTTEVRKVDAFLYANQRIAAKVFGSPLEINGGLIAKEIGILAPGTTSNRWGSRYSMFDKVDCETASSLFNPANWPGGAWPAYLTAPSSATDTRTSQEIAEANLAYLLQEETEDCAFTINYDNRLRNGGFGFNLVEMPVGETIGWRLADSVGERVE